MTSTSGSRLSGSGWTLEEFLPRFDTWADQQQIPPELRVHVLTWIFTRADEPYLHADRAEGFDNLWFVVIPNSGHGQDYMACCSYWIYEGERIVRCDSFASLSPPY